MKYLFSLIALVFSLSQPNLTSAHAVVTSYSLKISPIHANQPDKVALTFNSQIELGLSQFFWCAKATFTNYFMLVMAKSAVKLLLRFRLWNPAIMRLALKFLRLTGI